MPKDACYHKVKARYKVFPSAYASGAIAKCRKVGAANYGTGGKKKKKTKKAAEGGVIKFSNGGGVKDLDIDLVTSGKMSVKEFLEKAEANIRKGMKDRSFKPKFTADSKGNVTKNFSNGGATMPKNKRKRATKNKNIARGCGAVMRRKETFYA